MEGLADNAQVLLLIFMRVTGATSFAPVLSRQNIPAAVRAGLSLLITLIISSVMPVGVLDVNIDYPTGVYLFMLVREALIGIILGTVTNFFFLMILFSGEIIDMQSGLGMARIFDPANNMQMSLYGTLYMIMLFFIYIATDSHLTYIEIIVESLEAVPLGDAGFSPELASHAFNVFSNAFLLAVKLTLPLMVAEVAVQFAVGILMKSVPQIQIMVLNIEIKVALAIFMMFLIITPTAVFMNRYLTDWIETLQSTVQYLVYP
ncbi:MAG: flagellar biosynthetic protein FliR [Ruminococcus sp.]|jgi:flagellar biosynthetic protein FliR|nr:flagellar biosynthetic protein FliR [Ruminococcus sp.]